VWVCVCVCDPELVADYPGSLVVLFDTRVRKIRNEISIQQIF